MVKPTRVPSCEHANHVTKEPSGLHMTTVSMKPAVGTPCVECPLRRDSAPGYLGGYSPEMYLDVLHSPASIACHLSPGFQERDIARQRHCTGVAGYRANVGWIAGRDAARTSLAHESTRIVGSNEEMYFSSPEEFVSHHEKGQD